MMRRLHWPWCPCRKRQDQRASCALSTTVVQLSQDELPRRRQTKRRQGRRGIRGRARLEKPLPLDGQKKEGREHVQLMPAQKKLHARKEVPRRRVAHRERRRSGALLLVGAVGRERFRRQSGL